MDSVLAGEAEAEIAAQKCSSHDYACVLKLFLMSLPVKLLNPFVVYKKIATGELLIDKIPHFSNLV